MRPDDGALHHIMKRVACHPLHGHGLDFHPFERADEQEVDVGMIGREPQAIYLEGLQVPKLRQNVDLGSHLALHLERDKAAEDGRELGSTEVVDGIGRREFHVDELIMRAASHSVEEMLENVAISTDGPDFE